MSQFQFNPITRQLNLVKDAVDFGAAYKGVFDNGTGYVLGDVVAKSGKLYICVQAGSGHDPATSPAWWDLLEIQGPPGPSGPAGPSGDGGNPTTITTTQMASVTTTQIGFLATSAIGGISHNALGGLTSGHPHTQYALVDAELTTTQLGALTTTQLATLTQTQLGALRMGGASGGANGAFGVVPSPLAGDQDKVLHGDATWRIVNSGDPSTITTTQMASVTTTQIGFLATSAIGGISHNALGGLTSGHPHTQYALVDAALTTTQLGALTTTQLGMLSHDALGGVSGTGTYHLSAGQVASVNNIGTTTAFAALSATAVGALSTTAIGGISHNALGDLTSGNPHTQYALVNAALTTTQLGALTTTQLGTLNQTQLGALKMTGATAGANGAIGFVPAPGAGEQSKVLRGDGIWVMQGGGLTWRGVWDTNVAYSVNDVTSHNGTTYVCIQAADSTIDVPNMATTYWSVFMTQGSPDVTVATPVASASGSIVLDMALGGAFTTTLTENITSVTIFNPPASGVCGTVTWIVTQHASSAKSIVLPSGGSWATGTAPDFATLSARYLLIFKTTNGGANWTVGSLGGGGGVAGLTPGGVVFAGSDGKAAQDAGNLYWDNVNKRFGIGTDIPSGPISVETEIIEINLSAYINDANVVNGYNPYAPTLTSLTNGNTASIDYGYVTVPGAVGLMLYSPATITQLKFYNAYNNSNVTHVKNFKVQYYFGGSWVDANAIGITGGTGSGIDLVGNDSDGWVVVTLSPVYATGVRIYAGSVYAAGTIADVTEMQVWGLIGNPALLHVTSGGSVGIGNASPAAKLDVNNTLDALAMRVYRAGTGTTPIAAFYSDANGTATVQAEILCDGSARNRTNTWGGFSDEKLKENITDATPKLDGLLAVRVRNFNLIGDSLKQIGVIAQELEPIFPGLIIATQDTELIPDPDWVPGEGETEASRPLIRHSLGTFTKSVKYSIFVPMLIKALQELHAMHQDLAARVAALEAS
ncbi:MAG: tail fiber domain-containing protein [Magnetococcales bacterium]|nr:tail fiber domain-containing protein [Magnetococcales bacterium]